MSIVIVILIKTSMNFSYNNLFELLMVYVMVRKRELLHIGHHHLHILPKINMTKF